MARLDLIKRKSKRLEVCRYVMVDDQTVIFIGIFPYRWLHRGQPFLQIVGEHDFFGKQGVLLLAVRNRFSQELFCATLVVLYRQPACDPFLMDPSFFVCDIENGIIISFFDLEASCHYTLLSVTETTCCYSSNCITAGGFLLLCVYPA